MQQSYNAHYEDGHSAQQSVQIILAPHGVAINLPGGAQLWWPFEQAQVREAPTRVTIQHGPETLTMEGAAFLAEWRRIRNSGRQELNIALSLVAAAVILIGLFLGLLYYGLSYASSAIAALIPRSTEETLGRAALESLAPKDKRCIDPSIARITETLRAALPATAYNYKVYVAEDPAINAFAAPGGYIVLFRGLLDKTRKPEEAAAVLAHEIQHVEHRHTVKGMLRGVSIFIALAILTGDPTDTIASMAGTLGALHYQRGDEEQADRDGLRLLEAAHVDPNAMVSMLELLQGATPDMPRSAKYFSSHPLTEDRIDEIRKLAARAKGSVKPLLPGHTWPPPRQSCATEASPALLP